MNKAEICGIVASKTGKSKKETETFVEAFLDTVTETLAGGDKISLIGFGSWDTVVRKGREGINPRTKESIVIPSTKSVHFKVGKLLKEAVQ